MRSEPYNVANITMEGGETNKQNKTTITEQHIHAPFWRWEIYLELFPSPGKMLASLDFSPTDRKVAVTSTVSNAKSWGGFSPVPCAISSQNSSQVPFFYKITSNYMQSSLEKNVLSYKPTSMVFAIMDAESPFNYQPLPSPFSSFPKCNYCRECYWDSQNNNYGKWNHHCSSVCFCSPTV